MINLKLVIAIVILLTCSTGWCEDDLLIFSDHEWDGQRIAISYDPFESFEFSSKYYKYPKNFFLRDDGIWILEWELVDEDNKDTDYSTAHF